MWARAGSNVIQASMFVESISRSGCPREYFI